MRAITLLLGDVRLLIFSSLGETNKPKSDMSISSTQTDSNLHICDNGPVRAEIGLTRGEYESTWGYLQDM